MRKSLAPDASRDLLRELAALLIAIGVAMWVLRTGSAAGAFASFVILGIPAMVVLWMGLSGSRSESATRPWQSLFLTVGVILTVLALRQLANWLGEPGDASNGINVFWSFGLGAVVSACAARRAGVRFLILFACLLSAVALAGFLDAVFDGGIAESFGAFRGLMLLYSLVLAGIGVVLWRAPDRSDRRVESEFEEVASDLPLRHASEAFTAATAVAVFAGGYGITSALGLIPTVAGVDSAGSGIVWELALLLVGLVAVIAGVGIGARGLTWAGAAGLILFFYVVGLDVPSGERRPDAFGVWPALLIVVGSVFLAASFFPESSLGKAPRRLIQRLRERGRAD
ncbi:MAG: hypothetical protein ACKOBH_00655 [bacterium]